MSGEHGSSFFVPGSASDPIYLALRDGEGNEEDRSLLDQMWGEFQPFCPDSHFLTDARAHCIQRAWEMYLACVLLRSGFGLAKPPAKAPDIRVETPLSLWIEAQAPGPGDGADAVPPRGRRGRTQDLPSGGRAFHGPRPSEDSLILRCTSALKGKTEAWRSYLADGIVSADDAFVVAINLAAIEDSHDRPDLPLIVKALYGFGPSHLRVPIDSPEAPALEHARRLQISKKGGANVDVAPFAAGSLPEVAGVLYANTMVWQLQPGGQLGRAVTFVHNATARVRLPEGFFPFGREWVARDGELIPIDHRVPA
jgi:hypothetical protein